MKRAISLFAVFILGWGIGLLFAARLEIPADKHVYIICSPQEYRRLERQGLKISHPRWKPDSSVVLFDTPGNVSFESSTIQRIREHKIIAVIGADTVQQWLEANGWNMEDGK